MRSLRLPGYWYADATPEGAYVAAQFGTAQLQTGASPTDMRSLTAPAGLLQVRISPNGLKYAGPAASTFLNTVLEWDGSTWQQIPAAVAPNCAIFGRENQLLLADPAVTGSQGYRYLDDTGSPVPSYLTYAPGDPASTVLRATGVTDVYEATIHGDVVIGQGGSGGAVIHYQEALYQLEPGDTTFVRFNRSGSACAVAMLLTHRPGEYEAVLYWFDVSEIPSLPHVSAPAPVPVPIPVPVPEPKPMSVPDFSSDVHAACTARPDLVAANSLASVAELVHLACEAMHAKDAGFVYLSKVPGETQYEGRSQDSVIYVPANAVVKLFSGAGDPHPAAPVWVVGGAPRDTDHPIYPDPATFGAQPTPTPTPPPAPSPDLTQLLADVAALKVRISALENAPQPQLPDLSAYAKHGDKVVVSGRLSFFGVNRWEGTIE